MTARAASDLRLLLGVSSSIAAYRALDLASLVVKSGGAVRAVLTPNVPRLVAPAAFEAITGQKVVTSVWETEGAGAMDHLAATKWANTFVVAPATAHMLARLALGLADEAVSTFAVAWPQTLVIAPAMNPAMYAHPTVREHLATLRARGHVIVEPSEGRLACGDVGPGRLAPVEEILQAVLSLGTDHPDLRGKRVLITSGPTREFADPVRCITNPSTGKMGVALAAEALRAGAEVTLVTGPTEVPLPGGLKVVERVVTADEMAEAVLHHLPGQDVAIFAAAVSDWRPAERAEVKAKKEAGPQEMTLRLVRTRDVAAEANAARRPGQVCVGFAAESHDLVENGLEKMRRKGFDFVVANPITESGFGFASDNNRAILLTQAGQNPLPPMSKMELAREVLRHLEKTLKDGSAAATPTQESLRIRG